MSMELIAAHIAKANDLQQAGVKGMRWGFRKGPDGTVKQTGRVAKGSSDHQRKQELKRKKLRDLSNDEIKDLTQRLQLERKYRELNPGVIRRGQAIITQVSGVAESVSKADQLIQKNPQAAQLRARALREVTRALQAARKK